MTRKEAKEKAIEVKNSVTDFNNPSDEIGYDLYEFELDGNNLVVFAYIRKAKGTDGRKWYAQDANMTAEIQSGPITIVLQLVCELMNWQMRSIVWRICIRIRIIWKN